MSDYTPEQLITRLRANGGPLAIAAAKCIESLLRQIPKPAKPSDLPELRIRLIRLFNKTRINNTPRDRRETTAWDRIAKYVNDADVSALEQFYRVRRSESVDQTWSRKANILTLLNNYTAQIELAHAWLAKRKARQPSPPASHDLPEPTGWQQHAIGALGERSWHYILSQYPEEATRLHNLLQP
jgi:hypothetical protein